MSLIDDYSFLTIVLFAGIMFVSGLVHGTLGLGFPLIATPLLALFMDVRSAIVVTLLPTIAVNVASIVRGGHWRESIGRFWPLAVYAVIGSAVGSWFLLVSDPAPYKLLLAVLILLYLGVNRLGAVKMQWVAAHPGWSMLAFGLTAGVVSGTTNVMVPILIIYTLELGLAASAMVQVFNMCFFAGKIAQIGTFASAGVVGPRILISTIPLAGVSLIALLFGMAIRDRFPTDTYRNIVRSGLFVIAVVLIVQFFTQN
jgi:uncharacterized membrane protein YfcA